MVANFSIAIIKSGKLDPLLNGDNYHQFSHLAGKTYLISLTSLPF